MNGQSQARIRYDSRAVDLKQTLTNLKPAVEVKSRWGATHQVPVEVRPESAHDTRDTLANPVLARTLGAVYG